MIKAFFEFNPGERDVGIYPHWESCGVEITQGPFSTILTFEPKPPIPVRLWRIESIETYYVTEDERRVLSYSGTTSIEQPGREQLCLNNLPEALAVVEQAWAKINAREELDNAMVEESGIGAYVSDLEFEVDDSSDNEPTPAERDKLSEARRALEEAKANTQAILKRATPLLGSQRLQITIDATMETDRADVSDDVDKIVNTASEYFNVQRVHVEEDN